MIHPEHQKLIIKIKKISQHYLKDRPITLGVPICLIDVQGLTFLVRSVCVLSSLHVYVIRMSKPAPVAPRNTQQALYNLWKQKPHLFNTKPFC